jgi:hypothetical protein
MLWLVVALAVPAGTRAACVAEQKAVITLQAEGGGVSVPLEINGIAATFALDTGAERSVVTPEAVQRLGLARDEWAGTTMSGIGGIGTLERPPNADPRSISMGGIGLVRRRLSRDSSLAVVALPNARSQTPAIDGLLGGDFLSMFDLDLDIPHHRLGIYQVSGCAGRFLPWPGGYTAVPSMITAENGIFVQPVIDGKPLRAVLDTGATTSLLGAPGMFKLGLAKADLTADPAQQINVVGRRLVQAHLHRFGALRLGSQTIDGPQIWAEPIRLPRIADMVLGLDWIGRQPVWISYTTKQVFVAAP